MSAPMNRRAAIGLLGGGAGLSILWLRSACAEPAGMSVIGYLDSGGAPNSDTLAAFRGGLAEYGYIEGQNLSIINRWAGENYDRLPTLAAELVQINVSAIFASGTVNAALAAKEATAAIPIVFANGGDPVKLGLVASLNRPGGNATGLTNYAGSLVGKRLELLREIVPHAATIGFLVNPTNLVTEGNIADMEDAARSVGQQVVTLKAGTSSEIELAFANLADRVAALVVNVDSFYNRNRDHIVALAARYRIPTNYPNRVFTMAGGLMSYGDDRRLSFREAGLYVGRILKGEKPADLPVLQPTKFEFVINLKTAKALGLTFPPSFQVRADEVIE
jgi:putative ABC transport system substrate-binding protein